MKIGMSLGMRGQRGLTQIQRAIALLRSLGANAHVWIHGVGNLSGLDAANYLLSDFATLCAVGDVVGGIKDTLNPSGSNNVTQATTANKPMLRRGLFNVFLQSATLTNASWTKTGAVVTGADNKVALPATPSGYNIVWQSLTLVANAPHTMAVTLRGDVGGEVVWIMWTRDGVSYSRTQCTLTTTEQTFVLAFTPTTATPNYVQIGVDLRDSSQSAKPAETFYVGNTLVAQGTWTAVQILAEGGIPTTTATAASNPNAGKYWASYNGSNNYMSVASAPYQPSDDHVSIVGFRNQGSSAVDYVFSGARGDTFKTAGGHYIAAGKPGVTWYDGATTVSLESPTTSFVPMISTAVKRTNDRQYRINSTQIGATNTTALTTFTATYTYLGGASAGLANAIDVAYSFDGSISIVIAVKATLTDAQILLLERFAALFVPGAPSF